MKKQGLNLSQCIHKKSKQSNRLKDIIIFQLNSCLICKWRNARAKKGGIIVQAVSYNNVVKEIKRWKHIIVQRVFKLLGLKLGLKIREKDLGLNYE